MRQHLDTSLETAPQMTRSSYTPPMVEAILAIRMSLLASLSVEAGIDDFEISEDEL